MNALVTRGLAQFALDASHVEILHHPKDFYKQHVSNAHERIACSSLYMGPEQDAMVNLIRDTVAKRPHLRVSFLLDYLRSTRITPQGSTVALLSPLLRAYPQHVQAFYYHTPKLPWWLRRFPRYRELAGVLHAKVLVLDDHVLLTGANLSKDYFTNRQDRYMLIKNAPQLANYYARWIQVMSSLSLPWDASKVHVDPRAHPEAFVKHAHQVLRSFCEQEHQASLSALQPTTGKDTFLYPMMQAGQLGIRQHEDGLQELFQHMTSSSSTPCDRLTFTSGYWNPTANVMHHLQSCKVPVTTIVASPSANSFYTAKGIPRHVPHLYTQSQLRFLQQCPYPMMEYNRPGWTYHAKGIWVHRDQHVHMTTIGSSNYGMRSFHMDVESEALLVTHNTGLQSALQREADLIEACTTPIASPELMQRLASVPKWVRWIQPHLINLL